MNQEERSQLAEELFGEFLTAQTEGSVSDFEALVSSHPEVAEELRTLHREWNELESLRARLAGSRPVAWNPTSGFVENEDSGADTPQELLDRIQERSSPIGRYRFLGEVGRGGMGAVLRVRDADLRRDLAMKVILDGAGTAPDSSPAQTKSLGRFLEEAQVTGQLDHPGIVPVHECGIDAAGRVYFTMKLVQGMDLTAAFEEVFAEREGWNRTRALDVILKVCQAMAYAHKKGVIHRDLKPSNVMVGGFGAVYVMDWGLARTFGGDDAEEEQVVDVSWLKTVRNSSETDSLLDTLEGDVVGTPAYMSPEQAEGRIHDIGPATDVYAVGAMLYHLLAGRMPYVDSKVGPRTVLARVLQGPPKPLDSLANDIPAELVAVTEKAMAREPEQRYATMQTLAEDLRAFLEGRVVRAYETGAIAEMRKWVRRNKALAGAIAAGLLLALVGLSSTALVQAKARAQERRSKDELGLVNAALLESNDDLEVARNVALDNAKIAQTRAEEAQQQRLAADRAADFLVDLFQAPDPALARGREVTVKEILDRGVESIGKDDELDDPVRARLLKVLAEANTSLGRYEVAEDLFQRCAELWKKNNPGGDEELASRLGAVVSAIRLDQRPELVDELKRIAVELERRLGPTAPITIIARGALITTLTNQGLYKEALASVDPLLEDIESVYGRESEMYCNQLTGKANAIYNVGGEEAWDAVMREALNLSIAVNGLDHPRTIDAMASFGSLYYEVDRIADATSLLETAVREGAKVYGEDHPNYLESLISLAVCYTRSRNFDKAEEIYIQALARQIATLGEAHDGTITTQLNLANLLYRTGKPEEAEELLFTAHKNVTDRYGEDHPIALFCQWNFAILAADRGEMENAEALYLDTLERRRRVLGPDHLDTLETLWTIVDFYQFLGRFEEAIPFAEDMVQRTPESHPRYTGRVQLRDQVIEAYLDAREAAEKAASDGD